MYQADTQSGSSQDARRTAERKAGASGELKKAIDEVARPDPCADGDTEAMQRR